MALHGHIFTLQLAAAIFLSVGLAEAQSAGDTSAEITVHEWGTFTVLQNERGDALPGINIDDEPVPPFVYNLSRDVLARQYAIPRIMMKGVPRRHPYVTLRLETPVIYFYPPRDMRLPIRLDVEVLFRGGWLTEFYPHAHADAPGIQDGEFLFGSLTPETVGRLTWRNLQIGVETAGPKTDEHVWLVPRKVKAVGIRSEKGESEQFVFYRGVGNFAAPIRVSTDPFKAKLIVRGQFRNVLASDRDAHIDQLWLVHVRRDRTSAFRRFPGITVTGDENRILAHLSSRFAAGSYGRENLTAVRRQIHAALVADGLFDDEATALLDTWQRAYFTSPGLRLFFLVPRVWTDHHLPLRISKPHSLTRVMMGRIELISPRHRAALKELAATELGPAEWFSKLMQHYNRSQTVRDFVAGRTFVESLPEELPPDYRIYFELGRFRNAMLLDAARREPSANFDKFIATYDLHPFEVPVDASSRSRRGASIKRYRDQVEQSAH